MKGIEAKIEKRLVKGEERCLATYIDKKGKKKTILFPLGISRNEVYIELTKLVDMKSKKWSLKKFLRFFQFSNNIKEQ